MAQFVFEIGTEEMPARFVPGLAEEIKDIFVSELENNKIDFGKISSFGTPRRVCVCVEDIAEVQRSEEEVVTGPPARISFDADGNPTKAALGFVKGQGVDIADIYTVETDKGEYIAAKKRVGGGETISILPEICVHAVTHLSFPKKMRWGSREFAFGRPVRWFLALLEDKVVEFDIEGTVSGRETRGHRVLGSGPFAVEKAGDYFSVIKEKCSVVLDPEERKALIREEGDRLAREKGGAIVWNDRLLDEVANLVEFPKPIFGAFDSLYLELPREVLLTSMESHQKSFGVEKSDGKLMPFFLTVLNIEPSDVELVRKGWERVLKARLEDARFFWEADNESDFDAWSKKLDSVTFLAPLGSMGDKARRIEKLCGWLAEQVKPEICEEAAKAGRLAKCDLVSEMVYEFDSLQGIMGGIYAERKGFSEVVSSALKEQYLPAGPDTPVPASLSGAILSMADKADTLAGCFGLNMIPTGGADPYALRRCVLGICRIILKHGLRIDIKAFLESAFDNYEGIEWKLSREETLEKLTEFFAHRLKAHFTGKGIGTLVAEAGLDAGISDLKSLEGRLAALDKFSKEEGFEQAVLTFKRAANIIRKQGAEAGQELTGKYDPTLLESEQELALGKVLEEVAPRFEELWEKEDYDSLFGLLAELRPVVDDFFDNVMVMCDDESLRVNRLNLLMALVGMLSRLADFNALQV